MVTTQPPKPTIIKVTIGLIGLLSLMSVGSFFSSGDSPAQQVAWFIRTVVFTAAFVGVLSGTKIGRRFVIACFALLLIAGIFGVVAAVQSIGHSPALAVTALVLVAAMYYWGYAYVFGKASRSYYAALWETSRNESEAV